MAEDLSPELVARFAAIVGTGNALTDAEAVSPYTEERRGRWPGRTQLVLRPADTAEVSEILRLATRTGTPVVPQGGNTGLVGGGVPDKSGSQIVLSLSRMNRIRDIDIRGNTATVEAGVVLHNLQQAADDAGRLFPLTLASQGSCQIGGNLSANAGGVGALAYGVARDLVLGLEVVLPTGEIVSGLNRLKKDNTGYDLKNLFIGAEGTLGVITAAVVKLFPKPKGKATVWFAVPSPRAALAMFENARAVAGPALTAFELIPQIGVDFAVRNVPGVRAPLSSPSPWHVLMEVSSQVSAGDAEDAASSIAGHAFEMELATDGVVASSISHARDFWHLREGLSDAQAPEGHSIKHDISVPVAAIPDFMEEAERVIHAIEPAARVCAFGHMGDGNLHYNVSQPAFAPAPPESAPEAERQAYAQAFAESRKAFAALTETITPAVHDVVARFEGSISAEHGIGVMKREELAHVKDPESLALMRRIKAMLDPAGIMNPGKVL